VGAWVGGFVIGSVTIGSVLGIILDGSLVGVCAKFSVESDVCTKIPSSIFLSSLVGL